MSTTNKIQKLEQAIEETLELADSLSKMAKEGAGYYLHWGERVLQAVEPLRNIELSHSRVLEHNKMLLEANSEFVTEITNLRNILKQWATFYLDSGAIRHTSSCDFGQKIGSCDCPGPDTLAVLEDK